jgi:hypothetical protein
MHSETRSFYRADWGEGANRPLAPDPTPRFTILQARNLSLVSLSHVRDAVHPSVPNFSSDVSAPFEELQIFVGIGEYSKGAMI